MVWKPFIQSLSSHLPIYIYIYLHTLCLLVCHASAAACPVGDGCAYRVRAHTRVLKLPGRAVRSSLRSLRLLRLTRGTKKPVLKTSFGFWGTSVQTQKPFDTYNSVSEEVGYPRHEPPFPRGATSKPPTLAPTPLRTSPSPWDSACLAPCSPWASPYNKNIYIYIYIHIHMYY